MTADGSAPPRGPVASSWRRSTARPATRAVMAPSLWVLLSLAVCSALIAIVEGPPIDVPHASAIYLVAVVVAATYGTRAGVTVAFAAFLLYDLLFVEPRFTLTVIDPREWLNLVLLLVVGVAVGRLAGAQSNRAGEAERRLREAMSSFAISRTLATSTSTAEALPAVVDILLGGTGMDRIDIRRSVGGREQTAASGGDGPEPGTAAIVSVLARKPGDEPAAWVTAHRPVLRREHPRGEPRRGEADRDAYLVRIESGGEDLGAIHGGRPRSGAQPTREETRLLALAADQVGLAWRRERLAAQARDAEVVLRGEIQQRALLESVSHDLRTPLASIRAAAGHLADPATSLTEDERRAVARQIDDEAERLNELVRNLLDLSRIEGGALVPTIEAWDLAELLEPVVGRLAAAVAPAAIVVDLPPDLPSVLVDPVLFDQAVANVLENASRHAATADVTITARATDGRVALRIADTGPGVPDRVLGRLFERFYRAPGQQGQSGGSRHGLGIGLSVTRAALEAMGGTASASHADGGGLAIELVVPAAHVPPVAEPE
jgi:two-component system sensor histidine kinase KdpD